MRTEAQDRVPIEIDPDRKIAGYCPMGCGETLTRSDDGRVMCASPFCPTPLAVDVLLDVDETEHRGDFTADGFTLEHPLRERLEGELFLCPVHKYLADLDELPVLEGHYRVRVVGDALEYERLG